MTRPAFTDAADDAFPSTCWSAIRTHERALDTLASRYWRPVFAYVRRALARTPEEARDLTQDFFVWVADSGWLAKADPRRGRFRAFMKTALRNFVTDADRRSAAQKRGGAVRFVGLASDDGESAFDVADDASRSPEELLDAEWRAELVNGALERTREALEREGRADVYALFRDYYLDDALALDYGALARRHGVTTVDVSNGLMRAKRMFRDALRAAVLETVASRAELDDELAWLFEGRR